MKKTILLVLSLTFFFIATKAQTRLGLKGGLNLANVSVTSGAISATPESLTSFHAGVLLETRLTDKLLLQPNLLFSQKGYRSGADTEAKVNYIEIPVNLLYEANKDFTVGVGIYAAHALSGKGTLNGKAYDYDFSNGKANRFDLGVNLIAGYEIVEGIKFSVNYTIGTANILDNAYLKETNKVWGFSLTKFIGER